MIVRFAMEHFAGLGSHEVRLFRDLLVSGLQGKGHGRTQADKIAAAYREYLKRMATDYLAARKRPKVKAKRGKPIEESGERKVISLTPHAVT
jgi:hypothetical protein